MDRIYSEEDSDGEPVASSSRRGGIQLWHTQHAAPAPALV